TAKATSQGTYTESVVIPADAPVGSHQLVVIGPAKDTAGATVQSSAAIEVIAADATAGPASNGPATSLPNTGWSPNLLILGAVFAAMGVVLIKLGGQEDWTAPSLGRGWSAPVSRPVA